MAADINRVLTVVGRRFRRSLLLLVLGAAALPALAQNAVNTATVTPPTGVQNPGTLCTSTNGAANFNSTTGVCTATDSDPIQRNITLTKAWTNALTGDTVSLTITGANGAVAGSSTAPSTTTNATATAGGGVTVTLTEAFTTGAATNYTTSLACVRTLDSVPVTVTGTGLSRTITMPADSAVTCTYTNARIAQQLNLAKSWSAGSVSGHTASATTTGGTNNPTFSSTAPTNTTGTAVTVYAGDVVTLPAETFGGGATASTYTSTVACAGGSTLASGATGRSLTIGASATATTCTYTNTPNNFGVTLSKTWTNAIAGNAVSLTVSGASVTGATAGTSTAPSTTTNAAAQATTGSTVTLAEAFTTGAAANYTTTLVCTDAGSNPVTVTGTGLSRTITMPASAVTCTYTNARIAQQLNLAKSWSAGSVSGHTASATTTGGTANPTFSSTAPTNTTGTAVTVYAGDVVTLPAETFGGGATAAGYTTTVACAGGSTLASGATGRSLTIGANATATTCTYGNTPVPAALTLQKTVVNTGGGTAIDTNWTLTATGPTTITGTEGAAAVTNAQVNPGNYVLTEAGGPAGYTASNWVCTGATVNGGNQIALALGDAATCTITNTFVPAPSLTIDKVAGTPTGATAGSTIAYTFTVTNTGNVTLTNVVVNDTQLDAPATCDVTTLAPLAVATCTGTHTITQAEVNAGTSNNSATATGTPPGGQPPVDSPPDTTTTPLAPS
ncbi:beta strand repeat-containing protein, partial [Lysobacter sp. cf310]|uniref:beta strand repeat-containing protein n=1 Tax=Lysobacter sp. cf310 TaxID=1761790 RepID=UPI0015874EA5